MLLTEGSLLYIGLNHRVRNTCFAAPKACCTPSIWDITYAIWNPERSSRTCPRSGNCNPRTKEVLLIVGGHRAALAEAAGPAVASPNRSKSDYYCFRFPSSSQSWSCFKNETLVECIKITARVAERVLLEVMAKLVQIWPRASPDGHHQQLYRATHSLQGSRVAAGVARATSTSLRNNSYCEPTTRPPCWSASSSRQIIPVDSIFYQLTMITLVNIQPNVLKSRSHIPTF